MGPKRIIIVISSLGSGGAERNAALLASSWADRGDSVFLLTTFLSESEDDFYTLSSSVNRIRLSQKITVNKRSIYFNLQRGKIFRRIIKSINPDVVVSFMDHVNVLTLLCLTGTKIPVVALERSNPFRQHLGYLTEWSRPFTYRWLAFSVCCQTERVADRLKSQWGINAVVLPNPLNPVFFSRTHNFEQRSELILSVGRMTSEKGHEFLLRSWARLAMSYPFWKLRLVGDGEDRSRLEMLANKLQISDQVEFVGRVNDIVEEYQRAQIFVLPSLYEGFPNALLEAMALGCACIASDCESGPREMIRHQENGLLCEPGDIEDLSSALKILLDNSPLRSRLSHEAKNIREQYSLERHLKVWDEQVFSSLR